MNEWLKKFTASFKERWSKWTVVQKAIVGGIVVAVIVAVVVMGRVSHAPTTVPLFNTAISDDAARDAILYRLDQENVHYTVNAAGLIAVDDEKTARRMRSILVSEDLVPNNLDPYALFDVTNWSITDYERGINNLRAVTAAVKQHIEALDAVASADVVITLPERAVFSDEQEPTTASVILNFKPGMEMRAGSKQLQGVQKILLRSVVGLREENITIADREGNVLNDFEGLADLDRVTITEKEQALIAKLEKQYRAKVLVALQQIFNADRVRDLNIKIDMDMSKIESQTTEYFPVEITPQDKSKPYDTRVTRDTLPLSSQTITNEWTGTGFNPEGPAGVEGQNPPVYSDMSNVIGKSTQTSVTQNNVMNTRNTQKEVRPSIGRVTVSANIDGVWKKKYDKNHNPVVEENEDGSFEIARTYVPVDEVTLAEATRLVRDAIGYNEARDDSVSVTSIRIDRTKDFEAEDAAYFKARQTRRTLILVLAGTIVVLIAFIVFRAISREMERRRRLREEEILRKQQAERERQLWEAKNEGMEVTMSVEERKRAELQENAIAMAKEHPEDVAMLIRTWMMEE